MKMIQLLRKKNQSKGFTLAQMILVLVIIAILAAALIPSMLGYIQEGKDAANAGIARNFYKAAQAAAADISTNGDKGEFMFTYFTNNKTWKSLTENLPKVALKVDGTGQTTPAAYVDIDMSTDVFSYVDSVTYYSGKSGERAVRVDAGTTVTYVEPKY